VFLEEPKGFLTALCKQEGAWLVGKRMLQKLSRDRRIVHHKNLNAVSRVLHAVPGIAARKDELRYPIKPREGDLDPS
jgi:hypothetical protein